MCVPLQSILTKHVYTIISTNLNSLPTSANHSMIGTDSYRIVIEISDPSSNAQVNSDYRYSTILVTSIDNLPGMNPGQSLEPMRAKLLGEGVIRLLRDFEDEDDTEVSKTTTITSPGDDTMVAIIAVPTYFTATDLLGFVGDHYMKSVTHIRILKSDKVNRFMVLIKFNNLVKAEEFQYHYDGKPFNSMEPETCHVVFVKSVVTDTTSSTIPNKDLLIPFLLDDPFTASHESSEDSTSGKLDLEPDPIELPTCPVCLERLDYEVTGLLTIPCQHTFHCQCLSKWRDDTCPVCRYTNNISNHKIRRSVRRLLQINSRMFQRLNQQPIEEEGANETTDQCMQCTAAENLWVCLICGNVGCSRYAPEQHSLKHFVETGHCFAMELNTSRVWDYAGDNYVHRLIASEADGKIVELPEKDAQNETKINLKDNDNTEYSELLLSQLISQREYYEHLLNENGPSQGMRLRRGSSIVESASTSKKLNDMESQIAELTDKFNKVSTSVIPALKQKVDMKNTSLRLAMKELEESNAMNEGLSAKVEFLTEANKKLKAENVDLQDQVKDLMFFLEAQEKFKGASDEVRDGTVVIQELSKKNKKKTKR